jgi:hypothetical protein
MFNSFIKFIHTLNVQKMMQDKRRNIEACTLNYKLQQIRNMVNQDKYDIYINIINIWPVRQTRLTTISISMANCVVVF